MGCEMRPTLRFHKFMADDNRRSQDRAPSLESSILYFYYMRVILDDVVVHYRMRLIAI